MQYLTNLLNTSPRRKSFIVFYAQYIWETIFILLIFFLLFYSRYRLLRFETRNLALPQSLKEKKMFWKNIWLIPLPSLPIILFLYYNQYFFLWTEFNIWIILLEFIIIMLVYETYFYRTHRILHSKQFYKSVHLTHHKSVQPTIFTSICFDWIELIVNYSFLAWYLLVIWLLWFSITLHTITLFLLFTASWNTYWHSWVDLYSKSAAKKLYSIWIMSSRYHDIHHSKNDGNYGFFFTFRDRICGTVSKEYKKEFFK